jgi:DNA (cytosine-5)-methyltransferase 1
MEQLDIFEFLSEKWENTKPIRLIELFAGYGSQSLALKYLGVDFTHWRICEWATKSIQAYNDLHIRDYKDYSQLVEFEEVVGYLFKKGISLNYNEPMTFEQIKRKGEKWCRETFNNIIATKNLVNIQNAKAKDFDITETDKYTYIMTYSFPCQDLSISGKMAGMGRNSGTRSGMLWEVERILKECEELPQILIMENVTQVHAAGNIEHLKEWMLELEKLGYTSLWKDMNSKNYGIPQNRDRTFMISILGKYNIKMPNEIELNINLKDLLEEEVDEKFYLSEKMVDYISMAGTENFKNPNCKINLDIARPLTTDPNKRAGTSNYISDELPNNYDLQSLKVKNATLKGYEEAFEGDSVNLQFPKSKTRRGRVGKQISQTLQCNDSIGVVIKDAK